MFEEHPDYQEQDLYELKYYETLIFDRVIVNYYAKRYKLAIDDLNALTQKFPDNEKYRNWLRAAKSYKLLKFEKVFYIFLAVAIFANILFEDMNPILDRAITVLFAICLLTIGGIEFIKWRRKKST